MELKKLQDHIRVLAILDESESPVISCYLNVESGRAEYARALENRASLLRRSLTGDARWDFEKALDMVEMFVHMEMHGGTKGAAIFARAGKQPFFLPLEFRVPLPNWIVVNRTPNIYHLVELKDTYHRYVVMISTEESARILEINLGSVTETLWQERPELRKRVGREWSKEHYQNHRRNRADLFIKEKISILDRLMRAGGHTHLILAGNPQMVSRVRQALPKHLAEKLVDSVVASGSDKITDIVAATLSSFVEHEEAESLAAVERLQQEIHTDGLAVAGTYGVLRALRRNQVDMLVMARIYEPEPGWSCTACGAVELGRSEPSGCKECGNKKLRVFDVREEMARLAEQKGYGVEIVNYSDLLMEYGGVGALLRYKQAG